MNIPFSVSRLSADNKECFVQIKIMKYVTTNILQPLGMTKTAYDLAEKVHDTIVEFIQNN